MVENNTNSNESDVYIDESYDSREELLPNVIIGLHSIAAALKNTKRKHIKLIVTDEAKKLLQSKHSLNVSSSKYSELVKVQTVDAKKFQDEAIKVFNEYKYTYSRVPSGALLISEPLVISESDWIFNQLNNGKKLKIVALDQVSDVHNGASIIRTSSFYGIDALVLSNKGSFSLTPSFFRTASGGTESVAIVRCTNLSRFIKRLSELECVCIGFSEHSETKVEKLEIDMKNKSTCFVFGSEDEGISNAVSRVIENTIAIKSFGEHKSLNVSVAVGIGLSYFFR